MIRPVARVSQALLMSVVGVTMIGLAAASAAAEPQAPVASTAPAAPAAPAASAAPTASAAAAAPAPALTEAELNALLEAKSKEPAARMLELLAFERLRCTFSEEKQVALLKRPLRSGGFIVFDKQEGVARITRSPRPAKAVVTRTTLRLTRGKRYEEIALDKSKELRAFAMVFPALLRGDREELERSFELVGFGSSKGRWGLRLSPRGDALRKLVRQVLVVGKGGTLLLLEVVEASGDRSRTWLTEQRTGAEVTGEELAAAFGGA